MPFRLFLVCFIAIVGWAQPGTISTVMGSGIAGSGGDGGPGRSAQLNDPNGVAVDSAGNIYVADHGNSKIRRLQISNDFMETVAGCSGCTDQTPGRPAGATRIVEPWDVTLDSAGSFYFPNGGRNRIEKVTNPGFILTDHAGSGPPGSSSGGFDGDGGLAIEAKLNNPLGVAVDSQGNVYFSDLINQRVRKISSAGIITTIAGSGTVTGNGGTAGGYSGDGGLATSAKLNSPHGVAIDAAGNLYIADTTNNRIRKVTPAGIITTVAGNGNTTVTGVDIPGSRVGDGGAATSATLTPWDVEVDFAGNLFITDWFNHRIRRVDGATGIITTIAGNGTAGFFGEGGLATSSIVNLPTGITLDAQGNIYFADSGNNRIRKIVAQPLGPPAIRTTNPVIPAFMGHSGFSSNMYVEIYGTNFSRSSRLWGGADFNGPNAPASLDGISVTVNNKPAFIYYVSPSQININVPDDTVTGSVAIQVRTAAGLSNAVIVTRSRLSPAMLTTPAFKIGDKQHVVALTTDFASFIGRPNMIPGVSFVTPRPGDNVSIYALGLGPTSPITQAGVAAERNSNVVLDLQVKIGGVEANVPFKGLLAGTIGLYQLNVTIPSVAAGDQKIELTVDGVKNDQDLTIVVGP
jgi:uncharacterized protein (TIGR03437 family)